MTVSAVCVTFSQIIYLTGACITLHLRMAPSAERIARPRPGHGSYELAFATKVDEGGAVILGWPGGRLPSIRMIWDSLTIYELEWNAP